MVSSHVTSGHIDLMKRKKILAKKWSSIHRRLLLSTDMAAVSIFWSTNMAAMTSSENDLLARLRLSKHRQPRGIVGMHLKKKIAPDEVHARNAS